MVLGMSRRAHLYEHVGASGQNLRLPALIGALGQQSDRLCHTAGAAYA